MSELLDRVRKGLECCVLRDPDDHLRCGECPYNPHAISNEPCANGLKFNALALINAQQERIREMEAARQWISVKDRLPDAAGCMVLVLAHNDHLGVDCVFTAFLGYGEMKWYTYDTTKMSLSLSRPSDNAVIKAYTITHWMPLPDPFVEV